MVTALTDAAPIARPMPLTRAAVALAEFHAQRLDIAEVLAALEASILLTPVLDGSHLLVGQDRDVTWVPTFTAEEQLRRYVHLRGEADRPWRYRRFPGAQLLGPVLEGITSPCGLAIDVAGQHPLLLPRRSTPTGRSPGGREVR
jgi:hypothetical protein